MLKETKWLQIFRTGEHTATNGESVPFADADLQELQQSFQESIAQNHRVPLVLGHPKDDAPAYGWLKEVKTQAGKLFGKFKDVAPEFVEWVNNKQYQSISPRIYPRNHPSNPTPGKLNFGHIGALGAMQPAVKGMEAINLSEQQDLLEFNFAEQPAKQDFTDWQTLSGLGAIAVILSKMRDRLIESSGVEAADQVYPPELMQAIQKSAGAEPEYGSFTYEQYSDLSQRVWRLEQLEMDEESDSGDYAEMTYTKKQYMDCLNCSEEDAKAFMDGSKKPSAAQAKKLKAMYETKDMSENEGNPTPTAPATPTETVSLSDFAELKASVGLLTNQNTAKDDRIAALEAQLSTQRKTAEVTDVVNFVEAQVAARKITPADKDNKVKLLLALPNEATVDFGEGVTKTPRQALMDDIRTGRELWSSSRMPTSPSDSPNDFADTSFTTPPGFNVDPDGLAIFNKAKAYQKQNNCDFSEAVSAVSDGMY